MPAISSAHTSRSLERAMASSYLCVEGVGEAEGWAVGWVEMGMISTGTVGYRDWEGAFRGFPSDAMPPTLRLFIRGRMSRSRSEEE